MRWTRLLRDRKLSKVHEGLFMQTERRAISKLTLREGNLEAFAIVCVVLIRAAEPCCCAECSPSSTRESSAESWDMNYTAHRTAPLSEWFNGLVIGALYDPSNDCGVDFRMPGSLEARRMRSNSNASRRPAGSADLDPKLKGQRKRLSRKHSPTDHGI